jgi:hypothetical protein
MRGIVLDSRGVVLVETGLPTTWSSSPRTSRISGGSWEKLEALYAKVGLTFPLDYETIRENRRPSRRCGSTAT